MNARELSPRQRELLSSIAQSGEAGASSFEFVDCGGLWFRNRERVLDALKRRGLITDDWTVTDAGIAMLAEAVKEQK
jgi:predicted transcriptional regulator